MVGLVLPSSGALVCCWFGKRPCSKSSRTLLLPTSYALHFYVPTAPPPMQLSSYALFYFRFFLTKVSSPCCLAFGAHKIPYLGLDYPNYLAMRWSIFIVFEGKPVFRLLESMGADLCSSVLRATRFSFGGGVGEVAFLDLFFFYYR